MSESSTPSGTAPVQETQNPAACAAQLKQLFPALFTGVPKPIKLRIQSDIQARAPGVFSKAALSAFLRRHTGSTAYLIAVTRASHRFDLDGQEAGELSEEHKAVAREELARRRARSQERQAQEENERRARIDLLRAFESTTLTRANFCALKGVASETLDELLAQARLDMEFLAQQRAAQPARHDGRDRRPGGRGADDRSQGQGDRRADGRHGPRREGDPRGQGPRREGFQGKRPGAPRPDRPVKAKADIAVPSAGAEGGMAADGANPQAAGPEAQAD
ncbi:MAG: ProQ/FinO family protein [Burkholderiaceae bacterium]|nr:ProQ/FinO family protein [Roseateles sp.]MBV8469514.1 ProQ/FinO family protein [Burkholderiaceae bacterium]